MQSPEQRRKSEEQFRKLVTSALDERWEKDGRYSAREILADIRSDDVVWKAMIDQFAEQAAVVAIRRHILRRGPGVHPTQESFPFAKDLPVPSIMYKGTIVSTLRSRADEYIWFSNWYQRRHTGTLRRSKFDEKTLAKLKRLARIAVKYRGDDPDVTMQSILEARRVRLELLHKQRKRSKRMSL